MSTGSELIYDYFPISTGKDVKWVPVKSTLENIEWVIKNGQSRETDNTANKTQDEDKQKKNTR